MPHRPHLTLLLAAAAFGVLSACSSDLTVTGWERPAEAEVPCEAVHAAAPDVVADQEKRPVTDDQALAWGDPAIILRCGIAEPEALEPTSQCHQIGPVGWFAEDRPGSQVFTTIGRDVHISVEVPDDYEPAADALIDLGDVIAEQTTEVRPCV